MSHPCLSGISTAPQRAVGGRSQLPVHPDQLQSEQVGGGRQQRAPGPQLGRPAGAEREHRRRHLGECNGTCTQIQPGGLGTDRSRWPITPLVCVLKGEFSTRHIVDGGSD